jgi:hypothetical protein
MAAVRWHALPASQAGLQDRSRPGVRARTCAGRGALGLGRPGGLRGPRRRASGHDGAFVSVARQRRYPAGAWRAAEIATDYARPGACALGAFLDRLGAGRNPVVRKVIARRMPR